VRCDLNARRGPNVNEDGQTIILASFDQVVILRASAGRLESHSLWSESFAFIGKSVPSHTPTVAYSVVKGVGRAKKQRIVCRFCLTMSGRFTTLIAKHSQGDFPFIHWTYHGAHEPPHTSPFCIRCSWFRLLRSIEELNDCNHHHEQQKPCNQLREHMLCTA